MFKKFDDLTIQTRILIATVLSLLFFIPYTYFTTPEQSIEDVEVRVEQKATSNIGGGENAAPNLASNAAPDTKASGETLEGGKGGGDIIATINSKKYKLEIDSLGRISQAYLLEGKFLVGDAKEMLLFAPFSSPRPLEVRFADATFNKRAFEERYSANIKELNLEGSAKEIILTQIVDDVEIKKIITFYPNGGYDLRVENSAEKKFFISPGMRPVADEDAFVFKGALVLENDDTIEKIEDGDALGGEYFVNSFMAATADRYYTTLFYTKEGMNVAVSKDKNSNAQLFVEADGSINLKGYIGPKDYEIMESIDPILTNAIEYGFITFFAKPLFLLLSYLHGLIGNWGWAIVMLTFLVRLVLYPLTYKGMVSMQKLKDIAPKMKEIQAKYKGDHQKMQAHMMELYKKHGANPMGGCLPMLMQIPVFFAIYRVLYNAIELKGAEWILWIEDMSVMDPYFILPILMGASMYLHQRMTPTTFTDPMQEKIFRYLPLIFTIFFITFPSGLVLYWFVNNLFSILQQYIINKTMEAKKKAAKSNEQ